MISLVCEIWNNSPTHRNREKKGNFQELGEEGNGEILVKGYKNSVMQDECLEIYVQQCNNSQYYITNILLRGLILNVPTTKNLNIKKKERENGK